MIRVGIVGAGLRGRMFHHALRDMHEVEVVGFAETAPAARAEAEKLGCKVYAEHLALYRSGLDAVIVATPDFAHTQAVLDAAAAGLHLLVEKPLATTVAEAQSMLQAALKAGVAHGVVFENRFAPTFLKVAGMLQTGSLGDVIWQHMRLSNTLYVPTRMLGWAASSSPVWFLMPHTVDLALWASGREAVKVQASGVRKLLVHRGIDTWDVVQALVTMDDGSVVGLESGWTLPESLPAMVDFKVEIVGSKSAVYVDHHDQMMRMAGERFELPRCLGYEAAGQLQSSAAHLTRAFMLQLQGKGAAVPDFHQGLRVTRVLAAIDAALEQGQSVRVQDT